MTTPGASLKPMSYTRGPRPGHEHSWRYDAQFKYHTLTRDGWKVTLYELPVIAGSVWEFSGQKCGAGPDGRYTTVASGGFKTLAEAKIAAVGVIGKLAGKR